MLNHHFEILGLDKSVSISSSSSLAPTARRSPAATLSNRLPLSSLCLSDRQLQPPRFCSALTKHWTMCCFGFLQAWMFIIKQRLRANISSSSPHVVLVWVFFFFNFALKCCQPPPSPRQVELYNTLHLHQFPPDCFIFWEREGGALSFFLNLLSHCLLFHPFYVQPESITIVLLLFPSRAAGSLHLYNFTSNETSCKLSYYRTPKGSQLFRSNWDMGAVQRVLQ